MFTEKQKVLYGSVGICEISEITKKNFGGNELDYYVLVPLYRNSSTVYVPVNSSVLCQKMRVLPSEDEIMSLFDCALEKLPEWDENKYTRHEKFVEILEKGSHRDIFSLSVMLYNKNEELLALGKRLHITDERAFSDAQRLIDEEVAYVLDIPRESVSEFISQKVKEVCNK